MIFEDLGRPIAYETAYLIESLEDPDLSADERGDLSLEIENKLRSLAIMALVSKSDQALFGQNLTRSGRVRLTYLQRLRREGVENDHPQRLGAHRCADGRSRRLGPGAL